MSLPSGYKRLEYIQSSGTQYINTGEVLTEQSKVNLVFSLLNTSETANVFGSRKSATEGNFTFTQVGGDIQVDYRNYSQNRFKTAIGTNKTTIQISGGSCLINSTAYQITGADTFMTPDCAYIFSASGSPPTSLKAKMKFYSCKIYDNGTLIRDFVPCQKPDGTIGLWDDVNSVFYGNAGTGTFTAGPVVASPSIFVNIDGIWKPINHIYVNINNIWQKST